MPKRVLDVGNCGPDHAALRRLIEGGFGAELLQADAFDDAAALVRQTPCDLILVNRKLDIDYSDGLEVIRRLKADPELAAVPVMLVSNYPEAQAEAVAAGAVEGFGKLALQAPATHERLVAVLGPPVSVTT